MKKILLPLFLVGTVTMMVIMAQTSALLKTPAAPMGIINLELANTIVKTNAILNSWAPTTTTDKIETAKINTYNDFLFLFFYAGFLFLLCKTIAANIDGVFKKAGRILATATLLAGFCDVLENIGILFSLNQLISPVVSFCTALFSVIKWGLVTIAILYAVFGLLVLAYRKINSRRWTQPLC